MLPLEQFSRTATGSCRAGLAAALVRHIAAVRFGNNQAFAEVFTEWPDFNDKYVPPSAVVLPGSWEYTDALMTPTLMEETWEPQGGSGWGLFKLSELNLKLDLAIRTDSAPERDAIVLAIESSFRAPDLLMDQVAGPRYGLILPLPEYYGLTGRFSLDSSRYLDSEDPALRNQRDAVFTVSAQAAQVAVGPVHPLALTVQRICDSQEA